jgi:hypothetical protein
MRMMIKTLNFFCRCNTQIGDGLIFVIWKCQNNSKFVLFMHLFVRIGENERIFNLVKKIKRNLNQNVLSKPFLIYKQWLLIGYKQCIWRKRLTGWYLLFI